MTKQRKREREGGREKDIYIYISPSKNHYYYPVIFAVPSMTKYV